MKTEKKSLREMFSATPTNVLKKIAQEEDTLSNAGGGSSDFLKIEDGENKFRFFPKHPGEEHFYHISCKHWLTVDKNKTGKGKPQPGRTTIPNSRVHAGTERDIIEEYITFVQNTLDSGKAEDNEKIASLTAYPNGLGMASTFVAYANKIRNGKKQFGLVEFKSSIRNEILKECLSEDVEEAIELDPYTDPSTGKPFIITVSKKEKKTVYSGKISKHVSPLTDEELLRFSKLPALSKISLFQYGLTQFETALEGLQYFDEENGINLFDSEEFQEIVEEVKAQYEEGKKVKSKSVSSKTSKKSVKKEEEDDDEEEYENDLPFDDEDDDEEEKPKSKKPIKKKKIEDEEEEEPEEDESDEDNEDDEEPEEEEKPVKKTSKKKILKKDEEEEEPEESDDDDEEEPEEEEEKKPVKKALTLAEIQKRLKAKRK